MFILGISAFFHDSAACLVKDGRIVAAAQEDRFTRVKHDPSFPENAIKYCLSDAGISIDDVGYVGFYEKPYLKFERIVRMYGTSFPRGWNTFQKAIPLWLRQKLWQPSYIRDQLINLSPSYGKDMLWDARVMFCEHHRSHAASSFYASPFDRASILVLDGVGEWAATSIGVGQTDARGVPSVDLISEIRYPDSLGMLYSAVTQFLGFKVNSGEYKVMGLAPYGRPRFVDTMLKHLIDLRPDGSYRLNMDYFCFPVENIMSRERLGKVFGVPPRSGENVLTSVHFDIAASLQVVIERAVLAAARYLHTLTGETAICLAGGVALNCVANGVLLREGPFLDVWTPPAAGDAGGAIGAALYIHHDVLKRRKVRPGPGGDMINGSLLGPHFSTDEITEILKSEGVPFTRIESEDKLVKTVAEMLESEQVIGWFHGRMEFGPRALGARSIIGDARSPHMQSTMNLKIKYRESFRPFAPAVLRESVTKWFDLRGRPGSKLGSPESGYDSPYMLLVAPVVEEHRIRMSMEQETLEGIAKLNVPRSTIPACTHVDYSARVQTVSKDVNGRFYRLLKAFEERTGVGVLVNTSFNVRGEPIVCSPIDALRCFLGTEIDALVLEDCIILKSDIPAELIAKHRGYVSSFALD